MDIVSLVIGIVIGLIIATIWASMHVRGNKPNVPGKVVQSALVAVFFVALMVVQVAATYAQTATPVPLNIPTNQIFTETNSWMATFAPVAAIGIGISIALAVLGYLGKMIKSAFN